MKYALTALWISFVLPVATCAQEKKSVYDSLTDRVLSRSDMQEDLQYLRKVLEDVHPGLYRYNTPEQMNRRMDSLYNQLPDQQPFYDYYRQLSFLIASIGCAHTSIVPGLGWEGHFSRQARLFPFSTHIIQDRLYVTVNLTADTLLKPGYEIETIDGRPLKDILHTLYACNWSDGYNTTLKTQRFNTGFFGLFYYFLIARPDSFAITARDLAGRPVRVKYPGLTMMEGRQHFRNNPVNKEMVRLYVDRKREDLDLDIQKDGQTAVLTIRSFGGKAAERLRSFLPDAMNTLHKKQVKNLVIDLRGNGGGSDSAGVFLFTWLIRQPARYYLRQHTITNNSPYLSLSDLSAEELKNVNKELIPEKDSTFSLKPQFTAGLSPQVPVARPYTGKVYILANGGTGSAAAEFVAAARTHQLGTIIGEETGAAYEGGNSGTFVGLTLTHSKIRIGIPLVYYTNATRQPFEKGHGVLPDHRVTDNMDNILQGIDTQKEFVFGLIRRGK